MNLLDKAIGVLREKGWTQGTYVRDDRVCALGALRCALTDGYQIAHGYPAIPEYAQAVRFLAKEIRGYAVDEINTAEVTVVRFNDNKCRDTDELIGVFKHASESLELSKESK